VDILHWWSATEESIYCIEDSSASRAAEATSEAINPSRRRRATKAATLLKMVTPEATPSEAAGSEEGISLTPKF
jgi:hypothetical protein